MIMRRKRKRRRKRIKIEQEYKKYDEREGKKSNRKR